MNGTIHVIFHTVTDYVHVHPNHTDYIRNNKQHQTRGNNSNKGHHWENMVCESCRQIHIYVHFKWSMASYSKIPGVHMGNLWHHMKRSYGNQLLKFLWKLLIAGHLENIHAGQEIKRPIVDCSLWVLNLKVYCCYTNLQGSVLILHGWLLEADSWELLSKLLHFLS